MRDYAKVAPPFWTGNTGRLLRALGRDEQLLALFLITNPMATMIGLYHLPLALIAHYLGWTPEGALKALRRVQDVGFCTYDEDAEEVWVREMAAHQIGEPLQSTDNRVKAITREWNNARKSKFYLDFHRRYKESFHLPEPTVSASPSEGASKPLRSQEQEQEHEQDQDHDHEIPPTPRGGGCRREPKPEPELPFTSEAFKAAWDEWQQYRTEKRSKLTPTTVRKQLAQLGDWGEEKAVAAIRQSIVNGWQGLFAPKLEHQNGHQQKRQSTRYDPKRDDREHSEQVPADGAG